MRPQSRPPIARRSHFGRGRKDSSVQEDGRRAQVPPTDDLAVVRTAARRCRACSLWRKAIQTVFGEGELSARIILVGEQPGDLEDRRGRPFVGPAGKLLDDALKEAGIQRSECYVTNAVKHFKWEPVGKRRIHKKPSPREIAACRPWLEAEVRIIRPRTIVCLGATAANAVLGSKVRVLRDRGRPLSSSMAKNVFVTIHPSMILRMPNREIAKKEYAHLIRDLRAADASSRLLPSNRTA
jgi:uracil-DNA glycosylase family protein